MVLQAKNPPARRQTSIRCLTSAEAKQALGGDVMARESTYQPKILKPALREQCVKLSAKKERKRF